MAWLKVNNKNKKPFKWWMHKVLCEWGWIVRNKYYKQAESSH